MSDRLNPFQPESSVNAWCPGCGDPVERGSSGPMGATRVTLSVSFSTSHHRSLLAKILLDDLPMDLPILLGKCKLLMAGLGPSVLPLPASYSSVWHLTWDISSRHSPVKRASPCAAAWVRSGTNELEVNSSWDPAQGLGCSIQQSPSALGLLHCRRVASLQCQSRDYRDQP